MGTLKGRLSRLENAVLAKPWQQARAGVRSVLAEDGKFYVYAESLERVSRERAMRTSSGSGSGYEELAAMEVRARKC